MNETQAKAWLIAHPGRVLVDASGDHWRWSGGYYEYSIDGEQGPWFDDVDLVDSFAPYTLAVNAPATPTPGQDPKAAFGATKPSLGLVPPAALHHAASAMEIGAAKYGAYNWRINKVEALTYVHAAMRHIADYLDGADTAHDSGVHNLGHAIASLAILLDAGEVGTLIDNRPPKGASEALSLRLQEKKKARSAG